MPRSEDGTLGLVNRWVPRSANVLPLLGLLPFLEPLLLLGLLSQPYHVVPFLELLPLASTTSIERQGRHCPHMFRKVGVNHGLQSTSQTSRHSFRNSCFRNRPYRIIFRACIAGRASLLFSSSRQAKSRRGCFECSAGNWCSSHSAGRGGGCQI
jgi:hypothetical protein